MTARAVVLRSHADGSVDVEIDTASRCEGCAGVCMWRRLPDRQRARIMSGRPIAAGTKVLVGLPERYILLGSLLVHGLPLAALLLGAVGGGLLIGGDLGALLGAAVTAGAALALASALRARLERAVLAELRLEPLPWRN